TTMRACSGRRRPAMALISEVLPAPERPKRAVRPPALSNAASSTKPPKRCRTATLSILPAHLSEPLGAAACPLDQCFRDEQSGERDRDRNEGQPHCGEI